MHILENDMHTHPSINGQIFVTKDANVLKPMQTQFSDFLFNKIFLLSFWDKELFANHIQKR